VKLLYPCLFLLAPLALTAQEYRSKDFRVEDGLPSNVVKAITQDSTGFFWITTDEGLVKFDGHNFTTYKSVLHSPYAKGFLHTRKGKLYMYGDLDLIEINNELDTVTFKSVLTGTRNPTDSTISFPKAMYEDRLENLWFGEPQSVVLLKDGKPSRFTFPVEDRSPHFLRSFNFFEDSAGFLYTVSFSGNVYVFNPDKHSFDKEAVSFPGSMSSVKTIGNSIWITTNEGLFRSDFLKTDGYSKPVKVADIRNASDITFLNDGSLLVNTWDTKHYVVNTGTNTLVEIPFRINTVNSSYQSTEGDIWMASIEGIVLLQKNDFYPVRTPDQVTFVEAIAEDTTNHVVYHCTIENLYKGSSRPGSDLKSTTVLSIHDGYFQSLAVGSKGLWASSAFSVFLINNDKVTRRWNFDAAGRFVHDIFIDKKENVWLSQAGNSYVTCLTSDLAEVRYPVPLKTESIVNCVREGSRGMYVASNGPEGYLFFKSPADSVFRNISIPFDFKTQGDFNVTDIAVTDSLLWLGTSEGLIRFNGQKLERIDLGDLYSNVPVKAVKLLGSRFIVFNNPFGLFRYDIVTGEFWRYDEGNGLPSNTIKTRGVYVDNKGRVWVGTSLGLAVSNGPLINDRATLSPRFVAAKVNGVEKRFTKGLDIPFGSFFTVSVSCISFPSEKIQLQYRIASQDSTWKTLAGNQLTLSELPAGIYRLETRAKKNGGYIWSKTSSLDFTVKKPFWQQTWFSASVLFLVALIAWSSFAMAAYINKKRRSQLEALVNQRTVELKRINEELSMRNSELDRFVYSTSHDLSAPLKSIRGLIMVAKMEETTSSQLSYLDMMEKSVKKLENFIADVINYSRNTRAPVQHIRIDFGHFIRQVLDDHQYAPNYSKITFAVEDNLKSPLQSDEMRLKIIFNNLISNAIKFHFINDGAEPYIKITATEENDQYVFKVEDNGTGIHPDLKDRIFDMFFRATDSVQGSGLGLYILRESVHKLNGQVEVKSTLGVGTSFIITLPKHI